VLSDAVLQQASRRPDILSQFAFFRLNLGSTRAGCGRCRPTRNRELEIRELLRVRQAVVQMDAAAKGRLKALLRATQLVVYLPGPIKHVL
jgi:hypothetical protein